MKAHASVATHRFAGRYGAFTSRAEAALRASFVVDDGPIGDTSQLLRQAPLPPAVEADNGEIFKLLNEAVEAAPQRGDLWMMRFETLRALGRKAEFTAYLRQAWRDPVVRERLDPSALLRMWHDLAGEAPAAVDIMACGAATPAAADAPERERRFADLARRIAGAEFAELAAAYHTLRGTPGFFQNYARRLGPLLRRPTRLQYSPALSARYGGAARIFLKREDLRHVSPETENAAAQAYVASQLGRKVLVCGDEVDAHCLELAAVAPRFGLQCLIAASPRTLGWKTDLIACLRILGAQVESSAGLPLESDDPREAGLRLWRQAPYERHLALSLGGGPGPYPALLSDFQSLMGQETALQLRAHCGSGGPRTFVAAVHSAADAIGFMLPQMAGTETELVYVEPRTGGADAWYPSGRLCAYNGAQRVHSALRRTGRLTYAAIADGDAYDAQRDALRLENAGFTLEDSRALAFAGMIASAGTAARDLVVLVA